tara:strand:+ start:7719 stop:8546 length:828 start_codon:yes stop_codon:yes gene_type:complete
MNAEQEEILRNNIRQLIEVVKQKKTNEQKTLLAEEERLRGLVRTMIEQELTYLQEASVPDNEPTPNKSTGINVLEDLLKKIIPVLQTDFKLLTTDPAQRESFRAHIINAVIDALTPAEANNEAGEAEAEANALQEEINIDIGEEEDEKFIDIRTDAEKNAEEEPEDPRDDFGVDGADETGRNVAYNAFKKIETSIIDAYELLSNAEDQELFYDYLIANLKLYFDRFENEIESNVEEPTNQAYDDAKAEEGGMEAGEAPEPPAPEEEAEIPPVPEI